MRFYFIAQQGLCVGVLSRAQRGNADGLCRKVREAEDRLASHLLREGVPGADFSQYSHSSPLAQTKQAGVSDWEWLLLAAHSKRSRRAQRSVCLSACCRHPLGARERGVHLCVQEFPR